VNEGADTDTRGYQLCATVEALDLPKAIKALAFVDDWPSVDRIDRLEAMARERWKVANRG
jgi:hypothetical protein